MSDALLKLIAKYPVVAVAILILLAAFPGVFNSWDRYTDKTAQEDKKIIERRIYNIELNIATRLATIETMVKRIQIDIKELEIPPDWLLKRVKKIEDQVENLRE